MVLKEFGELPQWSVVGDTFSVDALYHQVLLIMIKNFIKIILIIIITITIKNLEFIVKELDLMKCL